MGSVTIIVAPHMRCPYPYIGVDYATALSIFTHHMWIGALCIVGGAAHATIFYVGLRSSSEPNNLLDRVLRHRMRSFLT